MSSIPHPTPRRPFVLSGRARLALLLIAASLVLAGAFASAAEAVVTESSITSTSPGGPILGLIERPREASATQTLSVTGTSNGVEAESVELGCFYMGEEGTPKEKILEELNGSAAVLKLESTGSFTTTGLASQVALGSLPPNQPCTLRAVPVGKLPTEPVTAFKGPEVGSAGFLTKGAEATKLTDDELSTTTLQGFWAWKSAGSCGPSSNVFEPSSFQRAVPPIFHCAATLSETTELKEPSIVVDAHNGYAVAAASTINAGAVGQPFLKLGAPSFNEATGVLTQTETEPIVRCESAGAEPVDVPEPTSAACVQFASTGVELVRTVTTGEGGLHATVTDELKSTEASIAHTITLRYREQQGGIEPGYKFPGESAFKRYKATESAPTGSSAPETVYFQASEESAEPESPHENPRGAITLSAVPTAVKFAGPNAFELVYKEQTVPASGALTLTQALSQTRAAEPPTLSVASPVSGTTVSTSTINVAGSASGNFGIASLSVNGSAVTVANDGTWSTSVPLSSGANTISTVATDNAGKTTSRSITVTYTPKTETTVTETPAGKTPPAETPPGSTPVRARASLVGKVTGTGGKVAYTLACVGTAGERCNVTVTLYTVERLRAGKLLGLTASQKVRTKRIVLASGTLSIPAGLRVNVSVKLDATGRKLLARFGKVPARLSTILSASAGAPAETVVAQNVTITPVKKPKKK
jgi:hypothetical protein